MTALPLADALERSLKLCNTAGDALALVKPPSGTALSGAAWRPTARIVLMGLSSRHRTDDHVWFSYSHEAAHLKLHGKKQVFIDGRQSDSEGIEVEANSRAADMLVPKRSRDSFVASGDFSKPAVQVFANAQGIDRGIVSGRLPHGGLAAWSHLNELEVRLDWSASGINGG